MKTTSILLALSTILFGSAFAAEIEQPGTPVQQPINSDVQMAFPYVSLGLGPAPIPLPIFGAGYRFQQGHHGFDTSVNVATVYFATAVKASALYHYYFKPNSASQFYTGVGPAIGVGFEIDRHRCGVGGVAEFVFGKQYINDTGDIRFFQADIDFPLVFGNRGKVHVVAVPLVVLKYGIGF